MSSPPITNANISDLCVKHCEETAWTFTFIWNLLNSDFRFFRLPAITVAGSQPVRGRLPWQGGATIQKCPGDFYKELQGRTTVIQKCPEAADFYKEFLATSFLCLLPLPRNVSCAQQGLARKPAFTVSFQIPKQYKGRHRTLGPTYSQRKYDRHYGKDDDFIIDADMLKDEACLANKADLKYEVRLAVLQVMEPSRLLSRVMKRPVMSPKVWNCPDPGPPRCWW